MNRFCVALSFLLLCCCFARAVPAVPAQASRSTARPLPQKPSLDALRVRVDAYWSLLSKRQKAKALAYVQSASREVFTARLEPDFRSPRLEKIEFTADPKEVLVTVLAIRQLPPISEPIDWAVREKWVFRGGEWFVVIAKNEIPFGRSGSAGTVVGMTPEELDQVKAAIRRDLVFRNSSLDFGTVRQGTTARIPLEYDLKADMPLEFILNSEPSTLSLLQSGSGLRQLRGGPGNLDLVLETAGLDGEVGLKFTLVARQGQAEVAYDFELHGIIYAPVSIIPSMLRYSKGESEKEVEIRNNSKSEIQIPFFSAGNDVFRIDGLPRTLAPGEKCSLKFKILNQEAPVNRWETVYLNLAVPVEGLHNLKIPIMRNYDAGRAKKPASPAAGWIEEYLRKSRPTSASPRP